MLEERKTGGARIGRGNVSKKENSRKSRSPWDGADAADRALHSRDTSMKLPPHPCMAHALILFKWELEKKSHFIQIDGFDFKLFFIVPCFSWLVGHY